MWFSTKTDEIEISVRPLYRRVDSSPKDNIFVWTYDIKISNHGRETVQLLNRYWQIMDADNHLQEVHGPGVVGERPVIEPGAAYEYTSFTHLATPSGSMAGHYEMVGHSGRAFSAKIPDFKLNLPVRLVSVPGSKEESPLKATEVSHQGLNQSEVTNIRSRQSLVPPTDHL